MKNYYSASGDITSGPITTTTGNMSSTRDNIQTQHNAVSGKTGESHLRPCTALDQKTLTIPQSRRTFMELEQIAIPPAAELSMPKSTPAVEGW